MLGNFIGCSGGSGRLKATIHKAIYVVSTQTAAAAAAAAAAGNSDCFVLALLLFKLLYFQNLQKKSFSGKGYFDKTTQKLFHDTAQSWVLSNLSVVFFRFVLTLCGLETSLVAVAEFLSCIWSWP